MNNKNNTIKKSLSKKYFIATGIILLLIPVFVFILLSQEPKPDPASEKILRAIAAEQLGMDMSFIAGPNDHIDENYPFSHSTGIYNDPNNMTDEDFAKVLILNLRLYQYYHGYSSTGMELRDIKLLEKFTNLQKLNLGYFKYPEDAIPEWMKFLAKHGIIDIRKRFALDLSPLEELSTLQELYLGSIFIKDIKPLTGLNNLEVLSFGSTYITDLKPLIKLKNLQKLSFEGSSISDFESIKELTNLHRLNLSNIHISNLKPLKGLINLEELYIYNTLVTDLEPLKELINLKILYLSNAKISNLEPLKKLTKLEMIDLNNTQILNIEPLGNLTNLQELNLNYTKVTDIEPLTALENLERLKIRDCPNITNQQVEDLQKALPDLHIIR